MFVGSVNPIFFAAKKGRNFVLIEKSVKFARCFQ